MVTVSNDEHTACSELILLLKLLGLKTFHGICFTKCWEGNVFNCICLLTRYNDHYHDVLNLTLQSLAAADPGFPRGGGGAPTYDFAKFSQKLHEIEIIVSRGGAPLAPP